MRVNRGFAEQLNRECLCVSVDRSLLQQTFQRASNHPDDIADLIAERPHLFADAPVFLARSDAAAMMDVVAAIEAAVRLDGFREAALAHAPAIARADHGPVGAFIGYDFHITASGPKLIEVNTNAGGAFLNAFLARAQRACCAPLDGFSAAPLAETFEANVVAMFEAEWRSQRPDGCLRRIAIVDDAPSGQYLYPDFLLARRALTNAGYDVVIADASELALADGALRHEGRTVDLVYSRLVDFALAEAPHSALREAYETGAAVVTPNPRNHALYADKRNLLLLSDAKKLARWGLSQQHLDQLRAAPRALEVSAVNAEALWEARKGYFFKPASGYGGKAVYRGDKLTRSAWDHVRAGGYIAQEFAAPSERIVRVGDETRICKLDVRLFTYDGALLLAAARVYRGQTTNFRTPGGGFASVLIV